MAKIQTGGEQLAPPSGPGGPKQAGGGPLQEPQLHCLLACGLGQLPSELQFLHL